MIRYASLVFVALAVATFAIEYDGEDIDAYHFHTYFFAGNRRAEEEAMNFRKGIRAKINDGFMSECSLNRVSIIKANRRGPHTISQWELCCNKTSFAQATAFHMKNHGNLSVLIHPLTVRDRDDHTTKATWIGHPVPLDIETDLFDLLPEPYRCPVYPYLPDEIPSPVSPTYYAPIPGTEDFAYEGSEIRPDPMSFLIV